MSATTSIDAIYGAQSDYLHLTIRSPSLPTASMLVENLLPVGPIVLLHASIATALKHDDGIMRCRYTGALCPKP